MRAVAKKLRGTKRMVSNNAAVALAAQKAAKQSHSQNVPFLKMARKAAVVAGFDSSSDDDI